MSIFSNGIIVQGQPSHEECAAIVSACTLYFSQLQHEAQGALPKLIFSKSNLLSTQTPAEIRQYSNCWVQASRLLSR